ncbi:YncE family protein [Nocardia sp. NPDC057440]|uniref:YncE family protein n=1 Tax=Nocardia sp. NPDC057440 TaxID=3346134 RepID=UPI0036713471
MRIVATITVGARPTCLAAFNSRVWVTNSDDNSVSVIDTGTNTVAATVTVGVRPTGVVADPQTGVFVANSGEGTITVLNLDNTPKATIEIEPFAGIPLHPVGVGNLHFAAIVVVFNRDGGVAQINHGPALPAATSLFDGGDPSAFTGIARSPHGVAFGSDPHRFLYVSNPGADSVSVFDISAGFPRHRARIPVGLRPVGVAAHPQQPLVYVANSKSDTVSVIHEETVIRTIDVAARPFGVAVDQHDRVWVTHDAGLVSMIDAVTETVTATVEVGSRPEGVAVDAHTGHTYVVNSGEGTVSVIGPDGA